MELGTDSARDGPSAPTRSKPLTLWRDAIANGELCRCTLMPASITAMTVKRWAVYRMRNGHYRGLIELLATDRAYTVSLALDSSAVEVGHWLRTYGVPVLRIARSRAVRSLAQTTHTPQGE